uniref:MTH538 TIR-like domain (DUF1863) n=1 Tax=Candidatus Kentrum sp. LFY TaxID=2126342 RepID=A0A450VD38_9GAMM|nr:MAG: MTH538 TIR-like domain (DUF1863) [Candidatus Kentron sp. LFY]
MRRSKGERIRFDSESVQFTPTTRTQVSPIIDPRTKRTGATESWTNAIRRKVFISHYKGNRTEVDAFINRFGHIFIPKVLGANDNDDFIDSNDTDYVMRRIRELYLGDSTITIVLLGSCTHSRRYVDWEIKSSLRQGEYTPNGLIGIVLLSQNNFAHLPPRLQANWNSGHQNWLIRVERT